jgi:hypothetical protein
VQHVARQLDDRRRHRGAEQQRLPWFNGVSPEWFRTYGLKILAGRDFSPDDRSIVGLVTAWLPARRASRIDPTEVLREG